MVTPKQTDPQFKLRMPAELKDEVGRAAAAGNRSLNAEIIARLEASFEAENVIAEQNAMVMDLAEKLVEMIDEVKRSNAVIDRLNNFIAASGDSPLAALFAESGSPKNAKSNKR